MKTEPIIKAFQPAIGKLVRAIRQELDLTQDQFAHELGERGTELVQEYFG
jgi:DNA-binding transcriptional regulator YiaG